MDGWQPCPQLLWQLSTPCSSHTPPSLMHISGAPSSFCNRVLLVQFADISFVCSVVNYGSSSKLRGCHSCGAEDSGLLRSDSVSLNVYLLCFEGHTSSASSATTQLTTQRHLPENSNLKVLFCIVLHLVLLCQVQQIDTICTGCPKNLFTKSKLTFQRNYISYAITTSRK